MSVYTKLNLDFWAMSSKKVQKEKRIERNKTKTEKAFKLIGRLKKIKWLMREIWTFVRFSMDDFFFEQ